MSKYRKQDIETLLRLQLGEAEKAKINAQQAVERLRESRQCAETYMSIIADKLQFSSSQFPQLSSGWCEELANAIAGLQAKLAVVQADNRTYIDERHENMKVIESLQQQVTQLRENVSKIECELSEWKLASAANETGHLFRCARVNGKWSCAKGCPAAAHTTLRGLVEEREYEIKRRIWQMHGARMGHQLYGDDGRLDCNTCFRKYSDESIETVYGFELYDANILCAKAATLPREGGAQDTISTKTLPSQYLGNCAEVKGDIS